MKRNVYRKRLREAYKEKVLEKHRGKGLRETHTERDLEKRIQKETQRNICRKRLKETHNEQTCGQRQIFQPDRNVETPKFKVMVGKTVAGDKTGSSVEIQ